MVDERLKLFIVAVTESVNDIMRHTRICRSSFLLSPMRHYVIKFCSIY